MEQQGLASAAMPQGRRATVLHYALAVLTGLLTGLAVLILTDVSLALVAAACLALVGGVIMLAIGQVRRPLLALLAFLIPIHVGIHFLPLPGIHEGGPSDFTITPGDLSLLLLCFLGTGEMAFRRRARVRLFPAVLAPAILFIALGMVSSVNARDPLLSAFQVFQLVKGLVFLLFVANAVRDEQALGWALAGLMAAVVLQSCLGIYQATTGSPLGLRWLGETDSTVRQLIGGQFSLRPVGTFWHTNQLAMFLGLALPPIGALLLVPVDLRVKVGAALTLSLGLVAAGFTLSRGSWIGLGLSCLLLVAFGFWRRTLSARHVLAGVTWLLLVLLVLSLITNGVIILRLTVSDEGSAASRISLMRGAWAIIREHPITGIGLNNYQDTVKSFDVSGEFTESGYLPIVHNIFLQVAAETGVLGLAAFLWLLAVLAWRALCYGFHTRHRPILPATVVAGLLASQLHLVVQNMVHVGLSGDTQLYVEFWFLAGLVLALTTWFDPAVTQAPHRANV